MEVRMAAYWMLIIVTIASVTGKPVSTMRTHKRQSDQRIAELETLLALQKYGAHHFLRQTGDGEHSAFPAYGIIDFNKIGRKKKSSPPEQSPDWVQSWASPSASIPSSETTRFSNRDTWNDLLDTATPDTQLDEEDSENDMQM